MKTPTWEMRDWTPADHALISQWRAARGAQAFAPELVPPNAVIVMRDGEPIAFAALFVTVKREGGAALGLCEFFTTAPGLAFADTRQCARLVLDFFRIIGREMGTLCLVAYCNKYSARVLKQLGMVESEGAYTLLVELLNS